MSLSSSSNSACQRVMEQLATSDNEAAKQVYYRFAERLIKLARTRLSDRLRQKVDPEEVVNSAFGSFFSRQAAGQFDVESWGNLWSLLVTITLRKCCKSADIFKAQMRDMGREVRINDAGNDSGAGDARNDYDIVDGEPTPQDAAILADLVDNLLESFEEGWCRDVVALWLQGVTVDSRNSSIREISEQVEHAETSVRRVLKRAMARLERLFNEIDRED